MEDRVLIIGGGVAGLMTALHLAPLPVTVIVRSPLGTEASTALAQGGIASAVGPDDDPELHTRDSLAAAAGLGDPYITERVVRAGPGCIEDLVRRGILFDRETSGELELGLEAAHSRHRIVHAGGDATGRAVIDGLIRAARAAQHIEIIEGVRAAELALEGGRVVGAYVGAERRLIKARAVVLATGGVGGLYLDTTNPLESTGSGLALAARAGAVLRDVEFVQFHPTAMVFGNSSGNESLPLATEALRGEGAVLVNSDGKRFMEAVPGAELAPRDVVSRAVWREIAAGKGVFLDARQSIGKHFPKRFPSVTDFCRKAGLDPVTQPIPVRPVAHYHMGGVAVEEHGRTSVPGLWACGEVAATGLHGANRLASNSLLEALAFARWIAEDIAGSNEQHHSVRLPRPAEAPGAESDAKAREVRRLMTSAVGVVREQASLARAVARLRTIALGAKQRSHSADLALVGLFIATAAHERKESRGGHFRSDYPTSVPALARPIELTLSDLINEPQAAAA